MALSLDHGRLSSGVPRLAPVVVPRPRMSAWLDRHSGKQAMVVVAPVGFGKTTAIVSHMVRRAEPAAYLRLAATDVPDRLRLRIGKLLAFPEPSRSYEELIEQCSRCAPVTLFLDEIDRAPDATRQELANLLVDMPANVSLILAGRSRTAVAIERAAAKGIAEVCDAETLVFDAEEIRALATRYDVHFGDGDIEALLEATEGWPLVINAALREAKERSLPLASAYEGWRNGPGRHFPRYVAEELSRASDLDRSVLQLALRGVEISETDQVRLADMEARGLLVRRVGTSYEPLRVLRDFSTPLVSFIADASAAPVPALNVRMLGRFEASIGDRPIQWIRRRDQQLFKYLLLQPAGAATRGELLETFWGDTDSQLATQSLRTACSNIRKAIASIAGQENVARYFSSRGDVGVNFANASTDIHRFSTLLRDGDLALEAGKTAEALAAYRAAETLYGGGLFSGEAPESWYTAKVQAYHALYLGLLERIGSLTRTAQSSESSPTSKPAAAETPQELPPNAYRPSRPLLNALRTRTYRP
jgi:hypothetical protein